jgi:hypothetical protein
MEELSEIQKQNREIRRKRILKGKIQSIIYPSFFLLFALAITFISARMEFFIFAIPVSFFLLMGWKIGKIIFTFGNIPYGLYAFYYFTSVLPYKNAELYVYLSFLFFCIYIVVAAVRTFGSEAVAAYLDDKNSD